jgi:indolepyruvate ferredoxin oxidoreductase alpha subunit
MIRRIFLGNEAIAWGLLREGVSFVTSYPGTPASEILEAVMRFNEEYQLGIFAQWSINEKVAFELALAHSWLGGRSAVSMKQVGLNVALDPLMSAAYTGVKGGLLVISADDPGPYSSQTEQDSRFLAMFAKIPVFDPSSPKEAMEMIKEALELSERYRIPVMLRPTSWVCHARQGIVLEEELKPNPKILSLDKDPSHWAALPRRRYVLHKELNEKLRSIQKENAFRKIVFKRAKKAVVSSGFPFALLMDVLKSLNLEDSLDIYKVDRPFPLSLSLSEELSSYEEILVLEETYPVIELQIPYREKTKGRLDGTVPSEGELRPENILEALHILLGDLIFEKKNPLKEGAPPRLCPGCPHRAAFWAIKKAFPQGFFPSDIGCYTLGLEMEAVDAFLCMGAGVSLAEGFYLALKNAAQKIPPICSTVGDSTFFHACIPALIDAVNKKAAFVLVILDNATTAMTGGQPTPSNPPKDLRKVEMEKVIKGCGVEFVKVVDPFDFFEMERSLKEAYAFCQEKEIPAVVISRSPCPLYKKVPPKRKLHFKEENCRGCMICVFESKCPALQEGEDKPIINWNLCRSCGLCAFICPNGALEVVEV